MKATRYIAILALAAGLMSCQRETAPAEGTCPDGFFEVSFSVGFPEPVAVPTRAKMGEGATTDDFRLYLCLYGPGDGFVQNWISASAVDLVTDTNGYVTSGNYKALLPITDEKRTIHIIANPPTEANPTLTDYIDNVMEKMVDSDSECSYWQEVVLENGIQAQVVGGKRVVVESSVASLKNVHLVRNFAKVVVTSPAETSEDYEGFKVKQWTLINVPTHGYVAPYTGVKTARFPSGYLNVDDYTGTGLYDQLTTVDNYPGYMPTDATIDGTFPGEPAAAEAGTYVGSGEALYMYERPLPTTEQPQTAILVEIEFEAGHTVIRSDDVTGDLVSYWYKIEVLDNLGAYVPFLRNIVYSMEIKGVEEAGEYTAEDALNGAYFGNISASLETADLNELSNGTSLIHVDRMDYTFIIGGRTETLMKDDDETPAQFYFIPDVADGTMYTATTTGICDINVTLLPVTGYDAAVTSISVNDTEVGAGTIQVTLDETDPTEIKKSIVRVAGKAAGGKEIYREITINLMEKQAFAHGTDMTAITNEPTLTGVGNAVNISIFLPEDLGASVFPIQVRIEAENNTLSATSPDLPVATGKSVFDASRNTYYFIKTIKYSDYRTLNTRTKKYEYTYEFPVTLYTSKATDNSSYVDIRDIAGNFNPTVLTLGTVTPVTP